MEDNIKEKKKPRFAPKDFSVIATYICDEYKKRKDGKRRQHREKVWEEIDRQLRMEPDVSHKLGVDGVTPNPSKAWMPELELPLQSETHEVLTADARRLMFGAPWFAAHAALTDKYLARTDFQAIVAGDENEVPSMINQDNADKLVEGWLGNFHKQYDFWGNIDLINGEAFKYGTGVGRARTVTKRMFMDTAKGVVKETTQMPVLFPRSIKNIYLDDSQHNVMNEGQMIGPSVIFRSNVKLADIQLSAKKGKNNPKDPDGGWMPKNLRGVEADKDGTVELLEYEGDLVVPKSSGSILVPGVIATVIVSAGDPKVVRFRLRKYSFSSYTIFPYHREDVDSPYGVGPLMKGMPIQKAATQQLVNLIGAGILNVQPPISYDRSDPAFAQSGGPEVFPSALWGTISDIKPHEIGNSSNLLSVYVQLLQQYADVTGVNASRLGAQTRSHTTAFAKEAELTRGTSRTVDYVESTLSGAMNEWLDKEFIMGKDVMGKRTDVIYLEPYRGFVEINKEHLPDDTVFDVYGAGGPAERQAKAETKQQAMQQAIQIEITKRQAQMGGAEMDLDVVQEEILRQGGWIDTTQFFKQEPALEPQLGPEEGVPIAEEGTPPPEAGGDQLAAVVGQLPGLITGDIGG